MALIAPDVCSSTPYSNFTSLRADAGVLDYCSSVLSTYKPTSTLIIVSTSVVAVARPADSTLTSISVVESTATVSQGAQSTAFTDIWVTKTELMTVTSYISVDTASASASASASACSISSASTLFASLHADQISTACSCLGVLPSSTSLNAMTFVTETKMSTVSRASAAATTFETGFVVLTAEAQTTMAFTFTTTAAETKTVYAAAPSYTQVFGPQTGCADISYLDAQQLNASVTAQNDAVNRCKEYCTSESYFSGTSCRLAYLTR